MKEHSPTTEWDLKAESVPAFSKSQLLLQSIFFCRDCPLVGGIITPFYRYNHLKRARAWGRAFAHRNGHGSPFSCYVYALVADSSPVIDLRLCGCPDVETTVEPCSSTVDSVFLHGDRDFVLRLFMGFALHEFN
jgi:hypothetical protein